ncbi:MAG: hypothetical protein ACM3ZQ_00580 [Bacillota bacterium]
MEIRYDGTLKKTVLVAREKRGAIPGPSEPAVHRYQDCTRMTGVIELGFVANLGGTAKVDLSSRDIGMKGLFVFGVRLQLFNCSVVEAVLCVAHQSLATTFSSR